MIITEKKQENNMHCIHKILFLFLTVTTAYNSQGQEEKTNSCLLKYVILNSKNDWNKLQKKMDFRTTDFNDFNFSDFSPYKNRDNTSYSISYCSYSQCYKLSKKISDINNNIDFFLLDKKDYVIYFAKMRQNSEQKNDWVQGFFIHNKSTKEFYFFGLCDPFILIDNINLESLNYIMKLDQNFIPYRKLWVEDTKVMFCSNIFYYRKMVNFEALFYYNNKIEDLFNDLNSMTLRDLRDLSVTDARFIATIYPELKNVKYPLWILPNYIYK